MTAPTVELTKAAPAPVPPNRTAAVTARSWAVLGAHGGAGASTVVELLRLAALDAADASVDRPELGAAGSMEVPGSVVELRAGQALPICATPVLVARATAYGLAAASEALAAWHPAVPRPWLVLVADIAAPTPAPVRYRTRALAGRCRGVATVGYLWPLRAADSPAEVASTRPFIRAARRLRDALLTEETR